MTSAGEYAAEQRAEPLISCIVIFLNEEKYLAEAIESVIAQTYGNWELLLVDDGSTDSSEAIARSYCERLGDRVRYLTHDGRTNRGMSASRNMGLRHARGEIAGFLDGDDCWYADKLQRQIAIFDQHPEAVMVCGATLYWHSWNANSAIADQVRHVGEWSKGCGGDVAGLQLDKLYPTGELMRRLYPLGKGLTPSSSGNIFRRDVALAFGGYEEAFRGMFEDQVFRAKMYLQGPIFVSSEVFDRYRQHAESCYQIARAKGVSDPARQRFFVWLADYLRQVHCRDWIVRLRLHRKMLRHRHPLLHRMAVRSLGWVRRGPAEL